MNLKLGTIAEEAATCREAFKGYAVGGLVLHCHHEKLFEYLVEPAENRIAYILQDKPESERALRLRLFRPLRQETLKADAEWEKAYAELVNLVHPHVCPNCPWNGKTIFA
jgi:hypothetical protein